ncbi:MAG: DegT/DnrJ/EryC1/StrS family aminotransferase [Candidatus Sericytochromatia bacterium]|nr:DegT/DnrJ/EryC1/StrS family aminotransferase [Candidatus Tanganyikabacteria bacterium]
MPAADVPSPNLRLYGGPPGIGGSAPPVSPAAQERMMRLLGLHRDQVVLAGSGREAASWWERHLAPPGAVLVPAYGCRSMIQPYLQASRGIRFYPVDRHLVPDREALMTLKRGAGSIHVVHYFGFPAPDWLYGLGLPVLEDAVQGLLDPQHWTRGRWAIGSFRKFGPVPAGGFLLDRVDIPPLPAPGPDVLRRWSRLTQLRQDKERAAAAGDRAAWQAAMARLAEDETGMDLSPLKPVALAGDALARLQDFDPVTWRASRREAYLVYQRGLKGLPGLEQVMPDLPPGVVPYGFPIRSEARAALKQLLLREGIETTVHWDVPNEVPAASFPDSHWLAKRILTLPAEGPDAASGARRAVEVLTRWAENRT